MCMTSWWKYENENKSELKSKELNTASVETSGKPCYFSLEYKF